MSRKIILRVNVCYYFVIAMLLIWGLFVFPQFWPTARILVIAVSIAFLVFVVMFSKCPHCGKGLHPGYKGTECPHCGKQMF